MRELAAHGTGGVDNPEGVEPMTSVEHCLVKTDRPERPFAVGHQRDARTLGAPARAPFNEIHLDPLLRQSSSSREPGDPAT